MESDFGRVIDALPGLVWTTRPDGYCDFLNRRWFEYTGLSWDEAIGSGWIVILHPDDRPAMLAYWQSRLAAGDSGEIEGRLRRRDGVYRWFHFRLTPVKDADGRIIKWCGLNTDIEDLKRAEERSIAHERRFRSIVEGLPAIVTLMTPEGGFAYGNQQMIDYLGAPFEALKARPTTQSFHPDDRAEVDRRWKHSVETGEPYDYEARLKGGDGIYRWFHTRGFPLRDPDGSIVLWYLLQENIDERRRADDDLRASEQNARAIVDGFPGLVAVFSADGFAEQVNQQMLTFWGKDWEQLRNWAAADLFHPEDVPRLLEAFFKAFKAKAAFELEVRGRRFDGVYRWLLSRGIPVKDVHGRIVRWYNLLIDIDERKRAEEARVANEKDLKLIIDTTPALMWASTPDGNTESVNQHFLDYVGMTWEQLQGQTWALAIHPDDQDALTAVWNELRATGHPGEIEARLRRYDGMYRWFLLRANPLRDDSGNIVKWYGVNTDIEDRKRADAAVRVSEHNLKRAIDATPALIWSADPTGATDAFNQHYLDFVGLDPEQLTGWGWAVTIHPDDREGLTKFWQNLLAKGEPGQAEARLRRHDGTYRWFLMRANPMHDENGNIIKWYGTNADIDDLKQAERDLRRSETFLAHGEAVSQTGSFLWRLEADEIRWSSQLYRIFDFELGTPITIERIGARVHPEDRWMLENMVGRAEEGGALRYEHRLLMPDSSVKHLHLVARTTLNENGRLEYIGTVQDVTERRVTEQALSKVRSELAHVARVTSLNALTASIAHEVNQPLAGIITNASTCLRMLAADPPNLDGARETARRTIRDGNRASDVISRLRTLFAKKEPTAQPIELNEAAREVIALSWNDLQRNKVVLRVELADDIPFVTGDRVQLQQVILNLILNASDAMSSVNDRTRQMVIKTEREEGDRVRLTVRDSGMGFGPRGAEKLFDAFYTTKSGGMGIGLSVSRSIIETHQGRLWAVANEGPGATFAFSLPRGSEVIAVARRKTFIVTDHNGNFVGEIPVPGAPDASADTRAP